MAEPQGINVPIVITSAIVTTILTFTTVAGVCAYYNIYNAEENAVKWDQFHARDVEQLKAEQLKQMQNTTVPMETAIANVIAKNKK